MVMKEVSVEDIISKMKETGLVPVFNHSDKEVAGEVLINSYQAGIRVFEFTNRGSNAFEVFSHLVQVASELEGLILGIGTIWSVNDAEKFIEAGAQFVVSPGLVPEMGEAILEKEMLWIPGCGTVSEVAKALAIGASLVKIFPGNVLGPSFAAAVRSVLPKARLMPTGGVKPTAENMSSWFNAGVLCVGMGSQLFSKNLIHAANYTELQDDISDALSLIRSIRQNS